MIETTIQCWNGTDKQVDAVLLFNVLAHLGQADRQALFQKLSTQWLTANGIVIVIEKRNEPNGGYLSVLERLGKPVKCHYDEAERDMLTAGFSLEYTQSMWGTDDIEPNPSEASVKFIQMVSESSEQEVRSAVAEWFEENQQSVWHNKFAIFRK